VLIVGLGNPGREYASHRHNAGFRVADALARKHRLSFGQRRGLARVAEGEIGGRHAIVAKPQTFMNGSGKSVSKLARAHGIPAERILVVYDDLDLPLGRLRVRAEGSSGGHRGIRSIIEALGTQSFPRVRVGIDRPPGRTDPVDYVLEPFDARQRELLDEAIGRAVEAVECWLAEGVVAAMDRFNRAPSNLVDARDPR
jgi:PTH1 family peptidyl-tRNA hydrolase